MVDSKDVASSYVEYYSNFDITKIIQTNGVSIFKLTSKLKELGF